MAQFSLKDWKLKIAKAVIVQSGKAGVNMIPVSAMDLSSHTMINLDPGGDADHLAGASIKPLGVIIKMAKPKIDIDFSNACETQEVCAFIGGIGSPCIVTLIAARSGMAPLAYIAYATWKNGGGMSVDDGKGSVDKVSFLATDFLRNGKSIYNKLA